jgi:phospholipase C
MTGLPTGIGAGALMAAVAISGVAPAAAQAPAGDSLTRTPIKHVLLIIGENRSFDHLFGLFRPGSGQSVFNLVSQQILSSDGSPGANFARARQWQAGGQARATGSYSIHPAKTTPFATLPPPSTDSAPTNPPFASVDAARAAEPALPADSYQLLTTGGTGLPKRVPDTRFPAELPNGPFVITRWIAYDAYAGDPIHRFFQMWQQLDCDPGAATPANPSGCQNDLFPWVATTAGAGSNGRRQPPESTSESTHQGGVAMGVYNSGAGDVGYLTDLAHRYALGDNYHQAIIGGTGANHIAIGYGGAMFHAAADGSPATPPANQIENPDAMPGTDNWYIEDGYAGGSYTKCADSSQPGVKAIGDYLNSLPYRPFRGGNCRADAYYLVNNYKPGYQGDGTLAPLGPREFTIPPSRQPNLGLLLAAHGIPWRYYGEGWDGGRGSFANHRYCPLCNPFQYSTEIMTNPELRRNLEDIEELYGDIANGALPAVAIVKPALNLDGHPASSKFGLFEAFCRKIVEMIEAQPELWRETAIMITTDESGGYYDSGYVQPIDFFGDGSRVPLVVVSPYSEGRGIIHTYYDHVSFDKFVEANWGLPSISAESRDNLPNPLADPDNPYVPKNPPAIGDLMEMFNFSR